MARKGTLQTSIKLPDGSRKYIYAKTQEELDRKELDLRIQLGMGIDLKNNDTFGEYAQMWYTTYKAKYLRPKSKEAILNALNTHILPNLSGYKMRDITPMHLQVLFNKLSEKSASLNHKVKTVLNEIFNTAVANNVIVKTPMVHTVRIEGKPAKEKEALTPEEEQMLLDALKNCDNVGAQNCYLFCLLALKTGLRCGELCGLMWSDINFEKAELTVTHNCIWTNNCNVEVTATPKTEAGYRTIPLTPTVIFALRAEMAKTNSLFVFHLQGSGNPLTQTAFRRMWSHTKKADIETKYTAHSLRHTFCTRLFEKGFDVKEIQYLMGHSTPEMTLKVYTHYQKAARFNDTASRLRAAL